jgi:cytochrome c oxidase subunit 4
MTSTHAHATDEKREPKLYAGILLALLILTAVTVGASYVHFGSGMANVIIALLIATTKASLVGLFFMHLAHDRPLNGIILVTSLSFVALLLIASYSDINTRDEHRPANLKVLPTPVPMGVKPAAPSPAKPGQALNTTTLPTNPVPSTSAPAH